MSDLTYMLLEGPVVVWLVNAEVSEENFWNISNMTGERVADTRFPSSRSGCEPEVASLLAAEIAGPSKILAFPCWMSQ